MKPTPGTVSKILWHFTGGPLWDASQQRQQRRPKPAEESYAALIGILRSKQIRLGRYREVVKVRLPLPRKHNQRLLLKVVNKTWSNKVLRRAAIHEAGHIVVAHALGLPYALVTIQEEGPRGGHALIGERLDYFRPSFRPDGSLRTRLVKERAAKRESDRDMIAVLFAGAVAARIAEVRRGVTASTRSTKKAKAIGKAPKPSP